MNLFFSPFLPAARNALACEAGGEETEKLQAASLPYGIQGYSTKAAEQGYSSWLVFAYPFTVHYCPSFVISLLP
jgi:hypothetical protein